MQRIELVGGSFGTGTAYYEDGRFQLPKGRIQSAANIASIEANATIIQQHWGRAVMKGVRNAAGLAPLAMVVGVFAAPLAVVGTIGIAAAAIGGALGLLGGGAETKSLTQIVFEGGVGFVAICETDLVETIRDDAKTLRKQAHALTTGPAMKTVEAPVHRELAPPSPQTQQMVTTELPQATDPSMLQSLGTAMSSGADVTLSAASSALSATSDALGSASSFLKRFSDRKR